MRHFAGMESPVGPLTLAEEDGALVELRFEACVQETAHTPLLLQAMRELEEYFRGERRMFEVPLRPLGTPFQQSCWQALLQIPYGQTRTYAWQAQQVGRARAYRAVGMGNHRNPLPIFIPCHRVVRSGGKLGGYAGGLPAKECLLALERMNKP